MSQASLHPEGSVSILQLLFTVLLRIKKSPLRLKSSIYWNSSILLHIYGAFHPRVPLGLSWLRGYRRSICKICKLYTWVYIYIYIYIYICKIIWVLRYHRCFQLWVSVKWPRRYILNIMITLVFKYLMLLGHPRYWKWTEKLPERRLKSLFKEH